MASERLMELVEKQRELMWQAEEQIWKNPETGYREWKTHAYMKGVMERLGYTLTEAGNIPGFYADLDTGRPGPMVVLMGEMDSVLCAEHPDCDKETGAAHACGHHAQCASLLGAAAALKEEGALDGLCGKIRLMAVPAEELLELEYRESLREKGIIRYFGGKIEFMHRGYFDEADLVIMLHTGGGEKRFYLNAGMNGCISKRFAFHGKAAHAGAPHLGINALYASSLGMMAVNSLRETFQDRDHVRFHPIVTGRVGAVNVIPDLTTMESYVRASSIEVMQDVNRRVNRALSGAAAAMGAQISIHDRPGYSPVQNDPNMYALSRQVMIDLVGEENVQESMSIKTGSTDMGDISCVFPAIHPNGAGATGAGHGKDFRIADKESALTQAAKYLCAMAEALLKDGAQAARYIIDNKKTLYRSIPEYLAVVDDLCRDIEGVTYSEEGAQLHY